MIDLWAEHILISVVASLAGMIAGGVLGYALARILNRLYESSERRVPLAALVPWRAFVVALIVPLAVPFAAVFVFGPGARTGIATVAIAASALSTSWVTGILIQRSMRRSEAIEFIAAARTIAATAVALLAVYGVFGAGGGLGFATIMSLRTFDYTKAVEGYLLIVAAVLLVDLIVGFGQYRQFARAFRELQASSHGGAAA